MTISEALSESVLLLMLCVMFFLEGFSEVLTESSDGCSVVRRGLNGGNLGLLGTCLVLESFEVGRDVLGSTYGTSVTWNEVDLVGSVEDKDIFRESVPPFVLT